ncbi:MAG: VOC family protein [Gammaproteobacteria bacterium]|nr:VOC family protein [Gammaproteobacteria bacterium]MYJ51124.1 VOC family protein [Gammaproteobacteria bacterium]
MSGRMPGSRTVSMTSRLDHIVIAAKTLEEGSLYIRNALGVDIPPGGRHLFMGTHNLVMAIGEAVYLEVIAIDPTLDAPRHPRWFGLDDPYVRNWLQTSPRLLTWAINTPDLEALVVNSVVPPGEIVEAARDDLRWKVAFREDGSMPAGGLLPLCIEWQTDFHPASRMTGSGWRLESLRLFHNRPQWLGEALEAIEAIDEVEIHELDDRQAPYLEAILDGPQGPVAITGNDLSY